MGCGSHRKKQTREFADQKWDYINLPDFKSKGCGPGFAYGYLWFQLFLSIAVYGVDSFTAVNLLVFNRWSSQIEPGIPFDVSKWIFAICIILSFLNLAYEGIRAIRVMRRGNVAECFLDSLAVRWESIRVGSGQGWRRFLVFAELTKSKKGAEYIALFTYFSFQSWIRVLICSGPRQVINAFTLKSVYEAKLITDSKNAEDSFLNFFKKIGELYETDYRQAIILSGMCFTLVVWVFSALFLLAAILFYVFFLFHWLPRADGGLAGYCERKVNKALLKVVTEKVNKALAKGQYKAARMNTEKPELARAATLPTLPNIDVGKEDSLPTMPVLGRTETNTTLPPYTSRPASPGNFELSNLDRKRPVPSRSGTMASNTSYSSNAPLIGGAADMGYGRSASPVPTLPDIDLSMLPPQRPGTSNSQRGFGPRPGLEHMNSNSNSSLRTPVTESPIGMNNDRPPFFGPVRSNTSRTMDSYGMDSYSQPGPDYSARQPQPPTRQYGAYNPEGRSSPAPSRPYDAYGQNNQPPYQPSRSATGPVPPRGPQYIPQPQRNMTAPMPPRGPGFNVSERPLTPQGTRGPPQNFGGPGGNFSERPSTPQGTRGAPQNFGGPGTPQGQRGPPRGAPYGYDVESQWDGRY